jgi:hypothetical protein
MRHCRLQSRQRENEQLGTLKWEIPAGRDASNQIQAYASATSVMLGEKLTFFLSTETDATRFFVDIYRLGWYNGEGGRLMASQTGLVGHAQGYYDPNAHTLVDCRTCLVEGVTGLGQVATLVQPYSPGWLDDGGLPG